MYIHTLEIVGSYSYGRLEERNVHFGGPCVAVRARQRQKLPVWTPWIHLCTRFTDRFSIEFIRRTVRIYIQRIKNIDNNDRIFHIGILAPPSNTIDSYT